MGDVLLVLMRWLHIASMAALAGGLLYGGVVCGPAAAPLAPGLQAEIARRAAERFRPIVLVAIGALLFSGVYNILAMPGHSARYHMLLGIKLLLVGHVFAVALLVVTGKTSRPARAMTGAAISAFVIIAIAAYLRRIF